MAEIFVLNFNLSFNQSIHFLCH